MLHTPARFPSKQQEGFWCPFANASSSQLETAQRCLQGTLLFLLREQALGKSLIVHTLRKMSFQLYPCIRKQAPQICFLLSVELSGCHPTSWLSAGSVGSLCGAGGRSVWHKALLEVEEGMSGWSRVVRGSSASRQSASSPPSAA